MHFFFNFIRFYFIQKKDASKIKLNCLCDKTSRNIASCVFAAYMMSVRRESVDQVFVKIGRAL